MITNSSNLGSPLSAVTILSVNPGAQPHFLPWA